MMVILLGVLVSGTGRVRQWMEPETDAVVTSVRNASLASIIASSVSAGSADPGILFFLAFAVVTTAVARARRNAAGATLTCPMDHRHEILEAAPGGSM
ncbi:hypothetical protein [Mesorhizobium sp. ES1-3]|uniref:hypothetical protein n=1 Tax=Mesorhizobium sp. ES1-3 TaxID=2876628 RepID=UPI001CCCCC7D|nr:hypothetical protein [Mesorhizobium sp. ES1-3]MBZ9672792.1 hypothetical protein [Mesorhizobium sp. ES1-3]